MIGENVVLTASHESPDDMPPYSRLLSDAMRGDQMLFAREDSVESAWRIVEPVIGASVERVPLFEYEAGSWGPSESDGLLAGARWHNPDTPAAPEAVVEKSAASVT